MHIELLSTPSFLIIWLQWFKQDWKYQLIYLLYRWLIALYYVAWLITSAIFTRHAEKYLIYLTNWGFLLLIAYLLAAALSSSYKLIKENLPGKEKPRELTVADLQDPPATSCGCGEKGGISWYLSLTWLLFLLSSELSIPITIFYWFDANRTIVHWGVTLHVHVFNIVPCLVDVLFSGFPVRLLHFVYIMGFSVIYTVFVGVYHAAGGTNTDGNRYIYEVVDFNKNPITATIFILVLVFIVTNVMHLLYWGLYLLRLALLTQKLPANDCKQNGRSPMGAGLDVTPSNLIASTPDPLASSPACSDTTLLPTSDMKPEAEVQESN